MGINPLDFMRVSEIQDKLKTIRANNWKIFFPFFRIEWEEGGQTAGKEEITLRWKSTRNPFLQPGLDKGSHALYIRVSLRE